MIHPIQEKQSGLASHCQVMGHKLDQLISCDSHRGIVLTGKT